MTAIVVSTGSITTLVDTQRFLSSCTFSLRVLIIAQRRRELFLKQDHNCLILCYSPTTDCETIQSFTLTF